MPDDRLCTQAGAAAGRERRTFMEPILCPFCGGTDLFQENDYSVELDTEYWTVHHWECMECGQSFDKIEVAPEQGDFEGINESITH